MLHLLQRTVSPALSLRQSVRQWWEICNALREPPRKRILKIGGLEG